MSIISGTLADAGLAPFAGRWPQLEFILNRPASAGTALILTAPVAATITDATGAFIVEVVASDEMTPSSTYTVKATWDAGRELDVITDLPVPSGAWTFTDLLINAGRVSPGTIVYGFGPPPSGLQGVLYADITGPMVRMYAPAIGGI